MPSEEIRNVPSFFIPETKEEIKNKITDMLTLLDRDEENIEQKKNIITYGLSETDLIDEVKNAERLLQEHTQQLDMLYGALHKKKVA